MEKTMIREILKKLEDSEFKNIPEPKDFEKICACIIADVLKVEIDYKHGSNRFPDITFNYGGQHIGVEVKRLKSSSWKVDGNSAAASTSVEGLDEIYILAGKFSKSKETDKFTSEYKMRPMGECITDIRVTHKPRYEIDVARPDGREFCEETFRVKYDALRLMEEERREAIVGRYVAEVKYEQWVKNDQNIQNDLLAEIFVLFPEVFMKHTPQMNYKFSRATGWLFGHHILPRNFRDLFSSKGRWEYKGFKIPKIYETLDSVKMEFHNKIENLPPEILEYAWKETLPCGNTLFGRKTNIPSDKDERIERWLQLVCKIHSDKHVENVVRLKKTSAKKPEPMFRKTVKDILEI